MQIARTFILLALSAVMAAALPAASSSVPIRTNAAAIETNTSDTRIYYQGNDGAIHELVGVGSVASGAKYVDNVLVAAQGVIADTPLAVTTWGPRPFGSIRLYYVSPNGYVQEYVYSLAARRWGPGSLSKMNYEVAQNSSLLYALSTPQGNPRVGFQSADAPEFITEAAFNATGWSTGVLN